MHDSNPRTNNVGVALALIVNNCAIFQTLKTILMIIIVMMLFPIVGTRQCVRGLSFDKPWLVDRNFPEQVSG